MLTDKLGPTLDEALKIVGFSTCKVVMPKDFRALPISRSTNVFLVPVNFPITESKSNFLKFGLQALKKDRKDSINFNCIRWPRVKEQVSISPLNSLNRSLHFFGKMTGRPPREFTPNLPLWILTQVFLL